MKDPIIAALRKATPRGWIFDGWDGIAGRSAVHATPAKGDGLLVLSCFGIGGGRYNVSFVVKGEDFDQDGRKHVNVKEAAEFWRGQVKEISRMMR